MNVESTSSKITSTKTDKSSTSSTSSSPTKDAKTSFQDELSAAKTQDTKTEEQETTELANNKDANNTQNTKESQKAAEQNNANQIAKDQLNQEKTKTAEELEKELYNKSFKDLNSKIAAINELKKSYNLNTSETSSKTDSKTTDKNTYCKTINMDNKDIKFFLNLVDNQQMSAQNNQINGNSNMLNNAFTDIKSEATQQTVQVSSTLLDALNESVKTNKPFRIDFDSDVAVIMKVDKNGVLSANFIPGSAAVENYLRNNIEALKQSFNEQNLQYNELSYSNREKQEQRQGNQSKNNKENQDE